MNASKNSKSISKFGNKSGRSVISKKNKKDLNDTSNIKFGIGDISDGVFNNDESRNDDRFY